MLKISRPPPSAVNEEWNELTAPVDVPVVETAKSADADSPKRVSLPSIDGAGGLERRAGVVHLERR